MSNTIAEWLNVENITEALGKDRDAIYKIFGNKPEPIATIPEEYVKYLDPVIKDNTVYCGKGYFIDHAVNHHPEVAPAEYQKIPEILSNPDDVRLDTKNKERNTLVFIKKYDNNKIVIVSTYEDNDKKLVFHKSFFHSKKPPYRSLIPVWEGQPLSGATSDISHADKAAPAGNRLSGRNDNIPPAQSDGRKPQIDGLGSYSLSSNSTDKSSGNFPEDGEGISIYLQTREERTQEEAARYASPELWRKAVENDPEWAEFLEGEFGHWEDATSEEADPDTPDWVTGHFTLTKPVFKTGLRKTGKSTISRKAL